MSKIDRIDAATLRIIRDRINPALAPLAAELGISIRGANGRYGHTTGELKLELAVSGADGIARARDEIDWRAYCGLYGLKPEDRLKTVVCNGKRFQVVGINPSAPRYPIRAKRLHDGREFRLPASVAEQLKAPVAPPAPPAPLPFRRVAA